MKKINSYLSAFILVIFMVSGCLQQTSVDHSGSPIKIAISKAVPEEAYQNYPRWIRHGDSTAEYFDMYHLDYDSALKLLDECDGILFTGGTDIFPGRYGKAGDTARCWEPDFKRDTLEALLYKATLEKGMPVMGICRGLQVINVESGGTLFIDLPADLDTLVTHRIEDSYAANHEVSVREGSLLYAITGIAAGEVNSAHHQGIEVLGDHLLPQAYSEDGLIESITLADSTQYLMAVQWHPERMDYNHPLSGKLARRFLAEAKKYKASKNHE